MNSSSLKIKLGKIGKVSMCKRVLKHQTSPNGEIPFYKISSFGGQADTFISKELYDEFREKYSFPKKGDILISAAGTLGKTVIYDGKPAYFQDSNIVWIDNDESIVLNSFLYYFYQTKPWVTTNGSTINRIYNDNLRNIKLTVPDLPTQKSIAKVLSDLDAKIELNNKINRELEAMAKTLYDYWFVQFDFPFDFAQGKPDAEGKPYKSSGGKMVYNAELKREIPEGWEVEPINTKVKIGSGFPFNSDDYSDTGKYKIITIKNVQEGYLETSSVDYVSFLPNNISDFCILKEGDILMSLTGNVGRMCFVDQSNLLLNQRVGKLLGEKDFVTYAYFFFKRPENQKRLEKIAGGSSQANLSPIDAVKDKFPIPTASVLNNFTQLVNPLLNQILIKNKENQHLTALRDWLLPMLMNGQVTVKEAEEKLSMAAEPSVKYGN
jgi:type I restriction enzyme S subunit